MIHMAYRYKEHIFNEALSPEENLLIDRLFRLRLSSMAEVLEQQLLNPNTELDPFFDRLSAIVNAEWDSRQAKKFNRLLKQATLKYPNAVFDEALYEPDRELDTHTIELLAKCDWLDTPRNLLITGDSGTGKTYIANALCISALQQMRSVRYIRANPLINEAKKANTAGNEIEYVNLMASYDLLVIDDFGLMDLNMNKCRFLFEILETRDTKKATAIVSQLPVSKWWEMFLDNTYADACLSRITSKAFRLEFKGRDMRKAKEPF